MDNFDYQMKLIFLGDSGVGKSSLFRRFLYSSYTENYCCTTSINFGTKKVTIDDKDVKLEIWDTAGVERFVTAFNPIYFRMACGVIYVYDVTHPPSLDNLQYWINQVDTHCEPNIAKILFGNKCDSKKNVEYSKAREFSQETGIHLIETSAKTGENVEEGFLHLNCTGV